jgi:predicted neuraminidase
MHKRALQSWGLGCLAAGWAAACPGAEPGPPGLVHSEFIFEAAPFPSCHASTIAETKLGLIAAWFGGQHEKAPDVGIWSSRWIDGRWTAPSEVADGAQPDGKRFPCWNPVLFQPRSGPLLLFYKVGPSPSTWWGMLRSSTDGGLTWSSTRRLPDGQVGPVKNKPIQLSNGDLLCGSSSEDNPPPAWRVHFERTGDLGQTWSKAAPLPALGGPPINAIQPSILRHPDGTLQAVGRSRSGRLFQTWSRDEGRTWTPLTLTELPNPNAGTDAVTLANGQHVLVYNHTVQGRTPLNVAVSRDGRDWQAALVLEREPGEYSYPAVIQTGDGLVHITYTWKRERIKHVVLDPARLAPQPMREE